MVEICAVKPTRGTVVHLHAPAYQPGAKRRPHADRVSMCGVGIWPVGQPPRVHELVPLVDALQWTSMAPDPRDPRPAWSWCGPCIGHAVKLLGQEQRVLELLVELVDACGGAIGDEGQAAAPAPVRARITVDEDGALTADSTLTVNGSTVPIPERHSRGGAMASLRIGETLAALGYSCPNLTRPQRTGPGFIEYDLARADPRELASSTRASR